eukprot:TRINITY_DN2024_c0_g1_i6.p1 TRINITY_DN2024_c0_g1~~TRINITY_DN2024_c0_g1_i6.p1  ORF type:complete len:150 (+),score=37.17 TRINITY_DN2024_c0_g1_i6:126-575(+)
MKGMKINIDDELKKLFQSFQNEDGLFDKLEFLERINENPSARENTRILIEHLKKPDVPTLMDRQTFDKHFTFLQEFDFANEQHLRNVMNLIDLNKTDKISKDEVIDALKKYQLDISEETVDRIFDFFQEVSGTDFITPDQVISFVKSYR